MENSSPERVEVPANFEDASIDILVLLIADMLQRLMALNDRIPLTPESLTRFHSRSIPGISVIDYLRRIVRFTNVEKSILLVCLYTIDKICARKPQFTLSSLTCHRFIITSIAVCSKGLCDSYCPNNVYAKVGGVSVVELNLLEREFLSMIDWRLMCTRDHLQEYYVNLVRTHSQGRFFIASSDSSGSDLDLDTSCPNSPKCLVEPSAILVDPGINSSEVRPTIEQNMAFAAFKIQ